MIDLPERSQEWRECEHAMRIGGQDKFGPCQSLFVSGHGDAKGGAFQPGELALMGVDRVRIDFNIARSLHESRRGNLLFAYKLEVPQVREAAGGARSH